MKIIRRTIAVIVVLISLSAFAFAGEIEVYNSPTVKRPHRVLGTVEAKGGEALTRGLLIAQLKRQAAALGADAIMDVQFTSQRVGGHAGRTICAKGQHDCYRLKPDSRYIEHARATAIVFTKKESQ